ncbi:MAG: hypothetical protein ACM3Q2_05015 [Syntrophothermus sp.]
MYNISENNLERSLIQKAVRRGDAELTEKTARYLINKGDISWLRKRLYVIAYEDCWTYGWEIIIDNSEASIIRQYKRLATAVKNKNAAGLASLAMAVNDGDRNIQWERPAKDMISSVAYAVKNQNLFWAKIRNEPGYAERRVAIETAERAITRADFPGDKAMMLAAAYLSVKGFRGETKFTERAGSTEFPYWTAFDKHTDIGKDIIQEASEEIGLLPSRGMWLAFYFEGSLCGESIDAPFWREWVSREVRRMGFTMDEAISKWGELRPVIISKLKEKASQLQSRINSPQAPAKKDDGQLCLF